MRVIFFLLVILTVLFLTDLYAWQALRTVLKPAQQGVRQLVAWFYWGLSFLIYLLPVVLAFSAYFRGFNQFRAFAMTLVMAFFLSKLFVVLVLLGEDMVRGLRYGAEQVLAFFQSSEKQANVQAISRSAFISKLAMAVGGVPLATMGYGVLKGAHDYQVRRVGLSLPNLPSAFEGFKIVQLSDIHSGSFFSRPAVERGIKKVQELGADAVFFTGDLVNLRAEEFKPWREVFGEVKAPFGVYSTMGNHDYGLYHRDWEKEEDRLENVDLLRSYHKEIGWDLLNNESRLLEKDGEQLAVVGIENWSAKGNFPSYGDLKKALEGTEKAAVKLLLSHDPSHWEAEVLPKFPEVDAMFSGHTHGMQFGIEHKLLKWSPVQYVYKQWAGLYQRNKQYLYVNRGFGYIGYPGRVGIRPEITLITLHKS